MGIERLGLAWTTLGDRPAWFVAVGLLAGVAVALAAGRTRPEGRVEALALAAAGVVGAGAALPDTEIVVLAGLVLIGATAVALLADTVATAAQRVPGRWWWVAATATGILVAWPLLDGARGRPGTILIAPVVVAPVVAATRWPGPRGLGRLVAHGGIALLVVVLVARHTGLGDGTLRPALGGLAGAVLLGLARRATSGRAGRRPTSG